MIEPKVRPATLDDLDQIESIEKTFGADAFSRRSLRRLLSKTIVVDYDGVVAYCTFFKHKKATRIYSIAVDPRCRRMGFGKTLMKEVEWQAKQLGHTTMLLEVAKTNTEARLLYGLIGYVEVKDLVDYYEKGKHAIKLAKQLN
jgi:ribosomal-protein-alanine N-acetyltransferase